MAGVRVAMCQLNPVVGDLEGNVGLVVEAIERAASGGADLAVFTELVICGYPPRTCSSSAASWRIARTPSGRRPPPARAARPSSASPNEASGGSTTQRPCASTAMSPASTGSGPFPTTRSSTRSGTSSRARATSPSSTSPGSVWGSQSARTHGIPRARFPASARRAPSSSSTSALRPTTPVVCVIGSS